MKPIARLAVPLLVVSLLFACVAATPAAAKRYICVPCGLPCDTLTFAAPGVCPACGMALVDADSARAAAANAPKPKQVAILVFNGAEILDFAGPYEMFGAAGCDVYTVAATKDPITTAMGLSVVPKYTFANAPQPDVLVIPGGGVRAASGDQPTLDYIKAVTAHTQNTMSVCNGAFILANTGLLDGLSATTTYGNIPRLASQYPKINVVHDRRYVDNGKLITTAGLSAGMDGALHVIAKLFGTGFAQSVALGEEYQWQPDGNFARAALADREIPQIDMDSVGDFHLTRTEGDTKRWDIGVTGTSKLTADAFMGYIEQTLTKGKWTKVSAANASAASRTSNWRFTGSDGKPWKGTVKIESAAGAAHQITAAISIARAG